MFLSVVIVACAFLQEIDLTNKKIEPLDFWVRDPALDARKTNVESFKRKSEDNDIGAQFHYSRVRRDRRQRKREKVEVPHNITNVSLTKYVAIQKKHEKKRKELNKTKAITPVANTTTRNISDHQLASTKDVDNKKLRMGTEELGRNRNNERGKKDAKEVQESWPRVHKKHKDKKGDARSTRMTPVYLMQQPGDDDRVATKKTSDDYDDDYLGPYGLQDRLLEMSNYFPEANITVEVIGRTAEYNDIVLIKATERKSEIGKYFRADESKYVDEVPEKKIIFIVHGLNAMGVKNLRCMFVKKEIKRLLSYYFAHLDKFDIFVIPMANPDGFGSNKHLWSKNMSPQYACPGVALDRNFDVYWNSSVAPNSCSQLFPGTSPFSEPETKAIREVFHRFSHKIHAYLNVHASTYSAESFKGDAVLYPKGYTDIQADDDKYIDIRGEIDESMKNASFQVLSVAVDTVHNWYGTVFGTSVDYAATVYGIPYSMELVMQTYDDNAEASQSEEMTSKHALQEIWKRVIDVIFHNIWRNTKTSDAQ